MWFHTHTNLQVSPGSWRSSCGSQELTLVLAKGSKCSDYRAISLAQPESLLLGLSFVHLLPSHKLLRNKFLLLSSLSFFHRPLYKADVFRHYN